MTRTEPPWISEFLSVVSERAVEPRFHLHCSCGATIKTNETKEICRDCGATIEVVSNIRTPKGSIYKLRRKHRQGWNPLLWPPVHSTAITSRANKRSSLMETRHPPDFAKRLRRLGLLFLLAPLYLPLLLAILTFVSRVFAPPTVQQDRPHDRVDHAWQLQR